MPFSAVAGADDGDDEPAVDADRFQGPDDQYPGHWAAPPRALGDAAGVRLLSQETLRAARRAIERCPPASAR